MKIWVVSGQSGSYDDLISWYVAAYDSFEKAESHQILAQNKANEVFQKYYPTNYYTNSKLSKEDKEFDKNMYYIDHNGIIYDIITMDFVDSIEEYKTLE